MTRSAGCPAAGSGPVDVVIVNYNTATELSACVASLQTPSGATGRIVVVDNASADHSEGVARGAGVDVLPTGANLGFGRAANRGIAATTAAYVLVLNPDVTVDEGAIATLAAALDADPTIGVAGPEVCNLDGTVYPSARSFPSLTVAAGHAFLGLVAPGNGFSRRYKEPERPDWVSGAAMLVRREAFEAVGGFDEDYFMYVEDVDLCWRLARAGWRTTLVRDAVVHHAIGRSSERHPYRMIIEHHRSLWQFARRSRQGLGRAALPPVAVALVAHAALTCLQRSVRNRPPAAP